MLSRPLPILGDNLADAKAGLYDRPHPFLTVSAKFRHMVTMATSSMKLSFAVLGNDGEELAPPLILCNIEKDSIEILQSVLDYGPEFIISDLMRIKRLFVLCRRKLSQAVLRRICEFPVDTKIILLHEELCYPRSHPKSHYVDTTNTSSLSIHEGKFAITYLSKLRPIDGLTILVAVLGCDGTPRRIPQRRQVGRSRP
ncbi:uncharacterized protein PAC_10136 [Phialocephala subalpina]|uniref:Uncharacterized protein n=1 Tax=Phialocephala subalpina TaxID=576137 RepID=A0A1L7X5D8_9HELO|nr:uncharacterized protein PAC_10136 [Phialocephala subalpina]